MRPIDRIIAQARAKALATIPHKPGAGRPSTPGKPRCPACNSTNHYARVQTRDHVCRRCGVKFRLAGDRVGKNPPRSQPPAAPPSTQESLLSDDLIELLQKEAKEKGL